MSAGSKDKAPAPAPSEWAAELRDSADPLADLIEAEPGFRTWAPTHRGALMSRTDVRDPGQVAALEAYLTRPATALSLHPNSIP